MIRLLASLVLHLLANALGLITASILLDGFDLNALSLVTVTLIFTAVEVIAGPLMVKLSLQYIRALSGGIALVTTFVGLLITNIISDGLSIDGVSTWVLASLIVWLFSLIASLLLPLFMFKKAMGKVEENSNKPAPPSDEA